MLRKVKAIPGFCTFSAHFCFAKIIFIEKTSNYGWVFKHIACYVAVLCRFMVDLGALDPGAPFSPLVLPGVISLLVKVPSLWTREKLQLYKYSWR